VTLAGWSTGRGQGAGSGLSSWVCAWLALGMFLHPVSFGSVLCKTGLIPAHGGGRCKAYLREAPGTQLA
jgi:hypothetical protein